MNFRFAHNNFNVVNLEKSLAFYKEALGLEEVRRKTAEDGSFIIVFLSDGESKHRLELTWLRDFKKENMILATKNFTLLSP
jgi:Glyoxalase/Bleomycin resistance protein/Dioxygenase superfamily.